MKHAAYKLIPHRRSIRGCIALALLFSTANGSANQPNPHYLAAWLARPTLQFGRVSIDTASMNNAYGAMYYSPLWVDAHGLNSRGKAALEVLSQAATHGLNPERYHLHTLQTLGMMRGRDIAERTQVQASLELLLSSAIMRYAADMQSGSVSRQWNTGTDPLNASMQQATLIDIAQANDVQKAMESLAPNNPSYVALTKALAKYKAVGAQGGWPEFPAGAKLKPGAVDTRVESLRQILIAQGDMAQPAASPAKTIYDTATVEGVKRFQERHGIEPDGIIGAATQAALNKTPSDAIAQIELTLERMRWMNHDLGARYVLVNVPAYRLTAVAGNRRMHMDVIVGKPDTKTPMFSKEITNVIINPTWSVPAKIATREMLPKIRKNPDYLSRAGFSVVDRNGETIAPESIDWESDNFNYTFRQSAGDGNALGKVKFTIPNSDNIYLHDTSQPHLFDRTERSLSHGCIRLSAPKAMTDFVLKDAGWDAKKIDKAYDAEATRSIAITPLPVHLVYWTAWVDEAGRTRFNPDIYRMNPSLMTAMNNSAPKSPETTKLAMNQPAQ